MKRKLNQYTAYDDETPEETNFIINKKTILSHYDETINGQEEASFTIGNKGRVNRDIKKQTTEKSNTISLEYSKNQEITDYYTATEHSQTIKKPSKKKTKKIRKQTNEQEKEEEEDKIYTIQFTHKNNNNYNESEFIDDEDLQAALAKQRRIATKEYQKTISVKELTDKANLKEQQSKQEEIGRGGEMIISATSDFVNNLQSLASNTTAIMPLTIDNTSTMIAVQSTITERPSVQLKTESEDEADNMEIDNDTIATKTEPIDTVTCYFLYVNNGKDEQTLDTNNITDEPLVGSGLAATLALLSQKGLIKKLTTEERRLDEIQKERQQWMNEQKKKQLDSKINTVGTKKGVKPTNTNNSTNKTAIGSQPRYSAREDQERFKDYKPDVQLQYQDEFGRNQTQKEVSIFTSNKSFNISRHSISYATSFTVYSLGKQKQRKDYKKSWKKRVFKM